MAKTYEYSHYASNVIQGFSELRTDNTLCDGMLQTADEQTFQIHRCVLAAASPYFRAMFASGFKEASSNMETPITLPAVSSVGLKHILDYMYSGKLTLTSETVYDVLHVANMLQLTDILTSCMEFLIEGMSADTCFQNLSLAEKYELKELHNASESFILNNLATLAETKDFLELSSDGLCKYLKHDNLKGKEIDIFRAARSWIDSKPEREEHLHEIMTLINFKVIPAEILADEVMKYESLKCNEECFDMALSAVKYHSNVFRQPFNSPKVLRGEETIVVVASYTSEGSSVQGVDMDTYKKSDVFQCNQQDILVSKTKPMKCKLELGSLSLVNLNNFLYLFGTDSDSFASVAKRFGGMTGDWLELAPIPRPGTVGSSATSAGDCIVVVGGMLISKETNYDAMNSKNFINFTFRYTIACNDWNSVRKCPVPLVYHSSCSHDGLVYIAGGYIPNQHHGNTAIQVSAKLYVYDPKVDIWITRDDMNRARCEAIFEAVDDKLFLVGGGVLHATRYAVSSIEMYDVAENQWTTVVQSDSTTLMHAAASFVDGWNIVIVGGYNMETRDNSDFLSVFDTKSNTITTLKPKLEYSPCRHVCTVLKIGTLTSPY